MKKIAMYLIAAAALCNNNIAFSGSMSSTSSESNWSGFYLGGNAGYWTSQVNRVVTTASPSYINPTFSYGASNIANALAQMLANHVSLDSYGFIGGGQVGYNYQYSRRVLLGLDIALDGLTNSNNTYALQKTVNLVDFDEEYVGALAIKQSINYLGTVSTRLGYLYRPTFLVYGTGGFAYGNVTLNTAWLTNESLGSAVYPTIATQNNVSQTAFGWTTGGGVEWLFKPNFSAKIEYIYYCLNNLNTSVTFTQTQISSGSAIPWASAIANTALSVAVGTIRVGINYHF